MDGVFGNKPRKRGLKNVLVGVRPFDSTLSLGKPNTWGSERQLLDRLAGYKVSTQWEISASTQREDKHYFENRTQSNSGKSEYGKAKDTCRARTALL